MTIMVLGHWLEMRSISQAQGALKELARLLPDTARARHRQRRNRCRQRSAYGDLVLVRPGRAFRPTGSCRTASDINESMITGESRPVARPPERAVIAGTVNGSGSMRVHVTGPVSRRRSPASCASSTRRRHPRSRAQALADRAAFLPHVGRARPPVHVVGWLGPAPRPAFVIERVVTVLVIACPHALGLAMPLVVAISTALGARSGLLVRDRRGLEEARNVTAVFFDKTGTLTRGEFRVVETTTVRDSRRMRRSRWPRRSSTTRSTRSRRGSSRAPKSGGSSVPVAQQFQAIPGRGVQAIVNGRELRVGGPALHSELGAEVEPRLNRD